MKIKRLFLTALISMAALFITCGLAFASNAVVDSETYTHPSQFGNTLILDGIDVSVYQYDIDWEKVKKQGIDFAYIRLGYSYLASPHRTNLDTYFEQNYKNARAAGVMVGVYYYSTATSITEAQKEAKFVLSTLDDRELDLPVVYDFEMPSGSRLTSAYNGWSSSTRKTKAASNSLAFLNYIEKNSDYTAMFYSYRSITSPYGSPSSRKLDMSIIDSKYRVWLAQYSTDNSYERPFDTWQYTSSGTISGISGRVDCNFWYYDNAAEKTASGTKSIKNATVTLGQSSYTYSAAQKKPSVSVSYSGTTLTEGVDYKVHYLKNVLAGTAYARIEGLGKYSNVQLVPYTVSKAKISGATVSAVSDVVYSGKLKIPSPTVKYNGTTLKKGTDYTLSYSSNRSAGTATIKITGKGNFTGTTTTTFTILKAEPTFTGTASYTKNTGDSAFTLNTKSSNEDAVLTYKSSDTSIATVSSSGKVTLKGKAGTAVITVTSPETANYKAAATTVQVKVTSSTSIINGVEKTTIDASAALGEKLIHLTWAKSAGYKVDYFEVYRSEESGVYDDTPFYTTKSGTSNSYKNTKSLTSGVTYYYRLRGVRTIGSTKYYTQWSNEVSADYKASDLSAAGSGIAAGVENTTMTARSELLSGAIRVRWTKSYGYKMDYFEIYRSTKSGSYGSEPLFTTPNGNWTSYKNTKSLKKGTKYYYRVRGVRTVNGVKYYTQWSKQAIRTYR